MILQHLQSWCADAGEVVDEEEQERLDALIDEVEQSPPPGSSRPLENPLIFGNYQVSYVSTRRAPRQEGQRTSSKPTCNLEVAVLKRWLALLLTSHYHCVDDGNQSR